MNDKERRERQLLIRAITTFSDPRSNKRALNDNYDALGYVDVQFNYVWRWDKLRILHTFELRNLYDALCEVYGDA